MRVFVPKPQEDWVCDTIIGEFERHTRHTIVSNPYDAELIFLYARWIWNTIPVELLSTKKVISTVHHIVPEKINPAEFMLFDRFTTAYHVPNLITANQLRQFVTRPINRLPYWVNDSRWFVDETVSERCADVMGLMKDKLVLASFQRDTEGNSDPNNPKPKLEKGPDTFVDIVRMFSRDNVVAYVPGWRRNFITKNLRESAYDVVSGAKSHMSVMNDQYNIVRSTKGCYLVTSRYEGGPQAVFEAALTKTWILSTHVGIAPEVLHPDSICHSNDEFVKKLKCGPVESVIEHNYNVARQFLITRVVPLYDDMIEGV